FARFTRISWSALLLPQAGPELAEPDPERPRSAVPAPPPARSRASVRSESVFTFGGRLGFSESCGGTAEEVLVCVAVELVEALVSVWSGSWSEELQPARASPVARRIGVTRLIGRLSFRRKPGYATECSIGRAFLRCGIARR